MAPRRSRVFAGELPRWQRDQLGGIMSSNPGFSGINEVTSFNTMAAKVAVSAKSDSSASVQANVTSIDRAILRQLKPLSQWSGSMWKRAFDVLCVLGSLPITVPVFLMTGLAVRVTSPGPVLFRQQRMGKNGQPFTIFKFRTMPVKRGVATKRPAITTSINQRFTPVGPFLRRWKLDELPQLINVLLGHMSIVGPRPKMPIHQTTRLNCRPGITGRATIVFAREEAILSPLPSCQLDGVYHKVVLPLKQQLDEDYMSKATFVSDMKLICASLFRKWEDLDLRHLIQMHPEFAAQMRKPVEKTIAIPVVLTHHPVQMQSEFQAD
ncbi:sugar transferase [Acidobacteria bacterium AB60]|nr:sugar transferase [Acidobacteria bacterium AB60]